MCISMCIIPNIVIQKCQTYFVSFNSTKCILAHLLLSVFNLKLYLCFKYTKIIQTVSTQDSGYGELKGESSRDGMGLRHELGCY